MSSSTGMQHEIENEAAFRKKNETVQDSIELHNQVAINDGDLDLVIDENVALHYLCECSDENCVERIKLESYKYDEIHANRKHFIVAPGHEVKKIEQIIEKLPHYTVVKKIVKPDEKNPKLRKTDIDNR